VSPLQSVAVTPVVGQDRHAAAHRRWFALHISGTQLVVPLGMKPGSHVSTTHASPVLEQRVVATLAVGQLRHAVPQRRCASGQLLGMQSEPERT
jgi:hypothetical protein